MNSKYKFLCVILACVWILPVFSSCAGIGDGALFGNVQVGGGEPEAQSTAKNAEYAALLTDVRKCTVMAYGEYGEIIARAAKNGTEAQAVYDLIKYGEIDAAAIAETTELKNYIQLTFFGEGEKSEKYFVWNNDVVGREYGGVDFSIGYSSKLGYIHGLYERIADACDIDADAVSVSKASCVMNVYNSEGHSTSIAHPDAELQSELRNLLETAEHTDGYSSTDRYIRILFTDENGAKESYLIYTNDSVGHTGTFSSSVRRLGTLKGIYKGAQTIMEKSNRYKSKEAEKAGYSVSSLIVTVKSGYSLQLTDFSALDCIGIFHLMDLNTDETMYTFYFDSDTKDRIDEIAAVLASYEIVASVSYNYIMTLD